MRIDENVLAGYLAGELTESDRQSVTAALLKDRSLREWLHMAAEAMSAAKQNTEDNPLMQLMPDMEPARPGIRREDRRARARSRDARRAG